MHEMSIAEGIIDIAIETAKANNCLKIKAIQVQVGKMSGVEPEALSFCFDAITRGTIAEGATLEVELVSVKGQCLSCNHEFDIQNYVFRCPLCDSSLVDICSGKELRVLSVDLDT